MKIDDKLWDLANVITGFAIAQTLATIFSMAKGDLDCSMNDKISHITALIVAFVTTLLYSGAIIWCGRKGKALAVEEKDKDIWTAVTTGRVLSVWFVTLIMLGSLYGHHQSQINKKLETSCSKISAAKG